MRGKAGIILGLAVGYVLGSRAGRKRYDQIEAQWNKVWNLPAVQKQVAKGEKFVVSAATSIPGTLWEGAVKVVKAASTHNSFEDRVEAAGAAAKDVADEVAKDTKESARAAKRAGNTAERKAKKVEAEAQQHEAEQHAAEAQSDAAAAAKHAESIEEPKATD